MDFVAMLFVGLWVVAGLLKKNKKQEEQKARRRQPTSSTQNGPEEDFRWGQQAQASQPASVSPPAVAFSKPHQGGEGEGLHGGWSSGSLGGYATQMDSAYGSLEGFSSQMDIPSGSLGGYTTEGVDLCEDALGHNRFIQRPDRVSLQEEPEVVRQPVAKLNPWVQAVIMSEILTYPPRGKGRKR